MSPFPSRSLALLVALSASVCIAPALAAPVIVNGGFESGFTAWTRVDQMGGDGTFFIQSGTKSPVVLDTVPAPPQGSQAAMTDSNGPGAHVLYQDFVASAGPATLSFQLFVGNRFSQFGVPSALGAPPDTLDFDIAAINQQARVDILKASADPFSVAAADVLLTLFATTDATLDTSYHTISADISAVLAANDGQTLRLRFAETDNFAPFQLGVDDVRITGGTAVPEPGSFALAGLALLGLARSRRRA